LNLNDEQESGSNDNVSITTSRANEDFVESFTDYATAMKLTKKSDEIQVVKLKAVMGTECKQVLKQLNLPFDTLENSSTILE